MGSRLHIPHSTQLALLRRLLDHPARGHFLGPTLFEAFDRYARGRLARRASECGQQGCVECGDVTPFLHGLAYRSCLDLAMARARAEPMPVVAADWIMNVKC